MKQLSQATRLHQHWAIGSIRTRTGGHIAELEWTTVEYSSGGIEFPADSSHIVSDCVFSANGVGIAGSNVNIARCTFEKNTNAVNAVNVQLVGCQFFNNTNAITGSGICAAQNTEIWNNSGTGIYITGPVTDCLVHDNGGYGVAADSIADCLIYNNGGFGASAYNGGWLSTVQFSTTMESVSVAHVQFSIAQCITTVETA